MVRQAIENAADDDAVLQDVVVLPVRVERGALED